MAKIQKMEERKEEQSKKEVEECTFSPQTINFKGFNYAEVYKKPDKTYTYMQECHSKL